MICEFKFVIQTVDELMFCGDGRFVEMLAIMNMQNATVMDASVLWILSEKRAAWAIC